MSVYVIAEIGINYNGSLENCFKMIDVAVKAGCSAAKFQIFKAKYLYPQSAGNLDWKDASKEYNYDIFEAAKRFELPEAWINELTAYCGKNGIDFLSSVSNLQDLELAVSKGMKKIKINSYSVTHIPLVEAAAKSGLPIIMSLGGATLCETEEAVRTVQKYHNDLTLLHCSIKYPTPLKEVNMGVLDTLKSAFPEVGVGYSDHTFEVSDAPVQAVYLGANMIEKHITLDKTMDGPDHFFALEPHELAQMVSDVNDAKKKFETGEISIDKSIYGSSAKICYPHEKYLRDFCYMTLFAARDIAKGEVISPDDLSILRPGKKARGLEPKYLKLFKERPIVAKQNIAFEEPITWDLILG